MLVIVEPEQKKLIYINLLGKLLTSCQRILQYWYQIVQERHRLLGIRDLLGDWTIEKMNHSEQLYGNSCGLLTLKFAELYLDKQPLTLRSGPTFLLAKRVEIGAKILLSATRLLIGTREAVADVHCSWLVGFVALRPKSTAMVIEGPSVHLTTLFPGQA